MTSHSESGYGRAIKNLWDQSSWPTWLCYTYTALTGSHSTFPAIDFPSYQEDCCRSMNVRPVPTMLLFTPLPGIIGQGSCVSPNICLHMSVPYWDLPPISRVFTTCFLGFFPSKTIFLWEPFFATPLFLCRILSPCFSFSLKSVCA